MVAFRRLHLPRQMLLSLGLDLAMATLGQITLTVTRPAQKHALGVPLACLVIGSQAICVASIESWHFGAVPLRCSAYSSSATWMFLKPAFHYVSSDTFKQDVLSAGLKARHAAAINAKVCIQRSFIATRRGSIDANPAPLAILSLQVHIARYSRLFPPIGKFHLSAYRPRLWIGSFVHCVG
ncbi:hypothetical protein EJ04DRAFT_228690 [Polyplosphaeria fusca]|uniref:Uncharacterized protein n=1 Tax=Polyplosphaeria fusca TaxID=682080 RepID=A0A9P4V1R4_9PLEO|nr:hypothetical protein EJ04DRAFT_228690 [Polyplosphaeria fusca]